MAIGHDQAIFTDHRFHPVGRTFIDGGAFPDGGVVPYMHGCFLPAVFEVLGRGRNYGAREDVAILANPRAFHNGDIRPYPGAFSYGYVIVNGGKGLHHHILCNLRSGVYIRQGLVHSISF